MSFVIFFLAVGVQAQEEDKKPKEFLNWLDNKGWKMPVALTLSPGLLTEKTYSAQLDGYAGFLKDKIEIRGDITYMIGQYGQRPRFSMNHQLYFGALYHFSEKAFQPYLGVQPGVALCQSSEYGALDASSGNIKYQISVDPVGSVVGGFALYAQRVFFMFAETRYIVGKHKSNTYPVYLDEWRFAFGLGFYL